VPERKNYFIFTIPVSFVTNVAEPEPRPETQKTLIIMYSATVHFRILHYNTGNRYRSSGKGTEAEPEPRNFAFPETDPEPHQNERLFNAVCGMKVQTIFFFTILPSYYHC
jgi:hypothetical protein